jgi:putative SOS response-associated peptidase YedK
MCGRFNLLIAPEQLKQHFQLNRLREYEPLYNIAPGQKILSIVQLEDGSHKAVYLWWGLIPSWAKDRKIGHRLINARAETIAEKPSFRAAYRKRRCLVAATGFYEWQLTENGKQAYHIARPDLSLFAFAGLWEHWEQGGETIYSCTIITTSANPVIQPIHERMPVIVPTDHYSTWLNPDSQEPVLQGVLAADGYAGITLKPVSDWVNNPVHDDKDCLH